MGKMTVQRVADVGPADPGMSQEYFNEKYRAWLRRRGLTDPSFAEELRALEERRVLNFKRGRAGRRAKK